jgi:hypothetical protein
MLLLLENRRRKEQDVAAEMRRIHSLLSRPGTLNPKLNLDAPDTHHPLRSGA